MKFSVAGAASLCLCLFVLAPATSCADGQKRSPAPQLWKPGDSWVINVDFYPKTAGGKNETVKSYRLFVLVRGIEKVGEATCAKLSYTFGREAPPHLKPRYEVFYDRKSAWAVRADHLQKGKAIPVAIERFRIVSLVAGGPYGAPLNLLPPGITPGTDMKSGMKLTRNEVRSTAETMERGKTKRAVEL